MIEFIKNLGDVTSIGTIVSAILGIIPHIAAILSLIWFVLRIYESIQNIKLNDKKLKEK